MAAKHLELAARGNIPQARGVVVSSGEQAAAVRRESHRQHAVFVADELDERSPVAAL